MEKKTIYTHNGHTYEAVQDDGFSSCRNCDLQKDCFDNGCAFLCSGTIPSKAVFRRVDLHDDFDQLRDYAVDYWRQRVDELGISRYQIKLFTDYLNAWQSSGSDK